MDRESRREKIISDKMREVKLKMRTAEQKKDGPDVTPSELETQKNEEKIQLIQTTEQNFFAKVGDEERKRRVRYFGETEVNNDDDNDA